MVVEDEEDFRKILKHYLEGAGYEVVLCSSGEDGVKTFSDAAPDMVLLDVNLPGIDGYEVCRQFRLNRRLAHIPIMMITVQSQVGEIVKGLKMGADDYIVKPFDPEEVLARIAALFRQPKGGNI
ncbi:MAG: response regulator [Elusimicrobia bacterium]|nr:response regulator [Elusimicrobiota bacterium]